MGRRAGIYGVIAGVAAALVLAFGASVAQADTGDIVEEQHTPPSVKDGWQAGTCTKDTPTCSVETEGQFFEQAAGHPQVGFTQIIVKHEMPGGLFEELSFRF